MAVRSLTSEPVGRLGWGRPTVAAIAVALVLVGVVGALALTGGWSPDGGEPTVGTDDTGDGSSGDVDGALTWTVTVTRVVDGDTVEIAYRNGSTDTVRLLGVDTPEVHVPVSPGEFEGVPDTQAARDCLRDVGTRGSGYVRDRLLGESVTLRVDPQADRRGGYDRLLGYIVHDGDSVNYDLVAAGYARVYDSTFSESERFYDAEAAAQSDGRRVWACR